LLKETTMSIIFGVRGVEGDSIQEQYLTQLGHATDRYAPNGTTVVAKDHIGMGFQPYHTHERSNLESQPASGSRDDILTFDGRLDNRKELQQMLGVYGDEIADSLIALSAFERLGEECFANFVGDWALALWSPLKRSLYLARDHAGTRTLYFEYREGHVLWSTCLETFFAERKTRALDQEYAACYLAGRPLRDRTPYRTIRAVPPAHYLIIRQDRIVRRPHWQWMIKDRIRYQADGDYESHFLNLFGQAVARRTGPGTPIIAELSGGMDSTSIVCMSDVLRRSSDGSKELVDTMSFFNDCEPAWNEKPYFSLVEKQRGKVGTHIDLAHSFMTFEPPTSCYGIPLLPGSDSGTLDRERYFENQLGHEYSAILSGVGGDELLGGVPSPMPELADLLITCNIRQLMTRTLKWSLVDRSPILAMLARTATFMARIYGHRGISSESIPDWIAPAARAMCAYSGIPRVEKSRRIGLLPSTIENGLTWWFLLDSLPHLFPAQLVRREYRYPYLDRDLVEFLFRVPRATLLGPGRRRALMRSALRGIVPAEVLERKRKAYVVRKPLLSLQNARDDIQALFTHPLLAEYGLVIPSILQSAAQSVSAGREPQLWTSLMRSISLELWLRSGSVSSSEAKPFI
jgi:asparagine synthase (glutamine-hydrolysing)